MELIIDELQYASMAEFFGAYVQPISRRTKVKPAEIVSRMYNHQYGHPTFKSKALDERKLAFSSHTNSASIHYANFFISSWATQLVGDRAHREVGDLTHDPKELDPQFAHIPVHLAASANESSGTKGVKTVTKDNMMFFRLADWATMFQTWSPLVWYLYGGTYLNDYVRNAISNVAKVAGTALGQEAGKHISTAGTAVASYAKSPVIVGITAALISIPLAPVLAPAVLGSPAAGMQARTGNIGARSLFAGAQAVAMSGALLVIGYIGLGGVAGAGERVG
ncbi:hypothetical protein BT96DRAFT_948118 [Gymnopus androsaceus JB14]|uniref:Uncharacterized protein n=1 Tax=Gymnopus androsaceus JB14 TaxID=1447944 RepID=A0A6A4GPX2_9AGAR|nr:hypothetical protein BT96DRAFT_948118 [Gymnopus androsaceus JB14]